VPGTWHVIQSTDLLHEIRPATVVVTTSWRAKDIVDEIVRDSLPVGRVMTISNGLLHLFQG
jgi:hypothetical protein